MPTQAGGSGAEDNAPQRPDRAATITLEGSTNAGDLWMHHKSVEVYYQDMNLKRQEAFDFLRDRHWTEDEMLRFKQLNKTPVVMNPLHTSERTVVGLFIQNRYDVKFVPFEPGDQDISDLLSTLYIHTENSQKWQFKDLEIIKQAWACGVAYMEVYMEVEPGSEPIMRTNILNPFAVWFDPESRDLIAREDALFVDRATWLTPEAVSDKFEVPIKELWDLIDDKVSAVPGGDPIYRDISHLTLDKKNGRILCIERFYKVFKKYYYVLDERMNRVEVRKEARGELEALGQKIYKGTREELYLAVMAPAWSNSKYLYNDEYHCNPIDPSSKKVIWPILEMIGESLNGDPSGFVLPQQGAIKAMNSVMSNIVQSVKHSVSTGYLRKVGAMTDTVARNFDKNHSNADQVFEVNDEVPFSEAVSPIPKGDSGVSQDNYQALQIAKAFTDEASSTPPAIKGITENASTSGILNAQRIEQAFVQLQGLISNWKSFLRRRALLCQYYWQTYWTYEKTIRITGKEQQGPQPQFMTINQMVPEMDAYGNQTGAVQKINDVSTAEYDAVIDDSSRSSTYREKTQQMLTQIMTMPGVNADPALLGALTLEFSRVTDLSQTLKDFLKAHSTSAQQAQQQQQQQAQMQSQQELQGGQIQNVQAMQQAAQAEAEQSGGSMGAPQQNFQQQQQQQPVPA